MSIEILVFKSNILGDNKCKQVSIFLDLKNYILHTIVPESKCMQEILISVAFKYFSKDKKYSNLCLI